jgi:hypothetical protein
MPATLGRLGRRLPSGELPASRGSHLLDKTSATHAHRLNYLGTLTTVGGGGRSVIGYFAV